MISTTLQYAVRALGCLAALPSGEALIGRDLASMADVPANYLAKILLTLGKGGIVEATRGTGGGYRLARPAAEVFLHEVIQLFDPAGANPPCFLCGESQCSETTPCPVHKKWSPVRDSYLDFLHNTSLVELSTIARERPGAERLAPQEQQDRE